VAFLLGKDLADGEAATLEERFAAYYKYLESVRDRLPPSAYSFAVASWHYDPQDHRCPHDSWVDSLTIIETPYDDHKAHRDIEINVRLLGAYHDGRLELSYKKVRSYQLETPPGYEMLPLNVGHGDWLGDEVRLSERALVLHEVEFTRGSRWVIECQDIHYQWTPL
jgi:hypothetical protein